MQDSVRKAVEKGVVETRAAYAKAKTAAEEATGAFEASYSNAAKGVIAFNTKAIEALRANAEANFDFIKSVIVAKSVSEFVALQSEHARKQAEAISRPGQGNRRFGAEGRRRIRQSRSRPSSQRL